MTIDIIKRIINGTPHHDHDEYELLSALYNLAKIVEVHEAELQKLNLIIHKHEQEGYPTYPATASV